MREHQGEFINQYYQQMNRLCNTRHHRIYMAKLTAIRTPFRNRYEDGSKMKGWIDHDAKIMQHLLDEYAERI